MAAAACFNQLADWEAFLNQLDPTRIELGLGRVDSVRLRLFADIELPPLVLIAGTNGKGSTAALSQACLMAGGYRVGVYSSPHLLRLNERIVVNEQAIADADFVNALNAVAQAQADTPLTYFEFITLAALYSFSQQQLDVALLEVGLGGRLDAVNVFHPCASVVTNIGLDHCDWLGPDRFSIGFEKAGVFRPDLPAIYADEDPVASVIKQAEEIGAKLQCLPATAELPPTPNMPGLPRSIRWAVWALLDSLPASLTTSTAQRQLGFAKAVLAGRFQRLSHDPTVVVDVAHNAEACSLLARKLATEQEIKQWYAVFSAYKDKDTEAALKPLLGTIDQWFCAQLQSPRAAAVADLHAQLTALGAAASAAADVKEAYTLAVAERQALPPRQRTQTGIIVFGSFETVAAVLALTETK